MTTYTCKCGKTFQKNTEAGTTGFRMPDYDPGHECYGCPFVQTEQWREGGKDVDAYACRGSKVLDYQTDAYCCDSKGATLHVRTLDIEFIQAFFKDYLALPGHIYEHLYHCMDSPENGRRQYSFGFAANKQGEKDRKVLIDRYFKSEGERPGALPSGCDRLVREDVTPEQEKEIVLNQIKEAKAMAQNTESPELMPVTKYTDGRFIYYVAPDADSKFYVWYRDNNDLESNPCVYHVIPAGSTFEDEQKALDTYARQNGNLEPCSKTDESPEMEQISLSDDPAPESGSVPGSEDDLKMELVNDTPESGNDSNNSGDSDNENPPSDNDSDDSADDDTETPQGPCDWKNASGADEDEDELPQNNIPVGEPFSLMDDSFTNLINIFDASINEALRVAVKARQGFTFQAKITFDYRGGAFGIKHDEGYQFDPIKVKTKGELGEEIQIVLDEDGNPIIPYNREHQMNFNEIQPGQREYPPSGGTAKVDGNTGIVENYQEDGAKPDDPPASDDLPEDDEPEEKLYPCKNTECLFYAYDTAGSDGCGFVPDDSKDIFDVSEAVEENGCTRPEVMQVYADANPGENPNVEENDEGEMSMESEDNPEDEC